MPLRLYVTAGKTLEILYPAATYVTRFLSSGAIEVELKASGLSGIAFQVQCTHIPKTQHVCSFCN